MMIIRLSHYLSIYRVLTIPGGCLGFLPSQQHFHKFFQNSSVKIGPRHWFTRVGNCPRWRKVKKQRKKNCHFFENVSREGSINQPSSVPQNSFAERMCIAKNSCKNFTKVKLVSFETLETLNRSNLPDLMAVTHKKIECWTVR